MKPYIFCDRPADSREDLFPRWILKRVVTRQPLYRQLGDSPPEITDDQEVRVPCVCQTCSNNWMSRMERTIMRFLGPMIDDFSIFARQTISETSGVFRCNDKRHRV